MQQFTISTTLQRDTRGLEAGHGHFSCHPDIATLQRMGLILVDNILDWR